MNMKWTIPIILLIKGCVKLFNTEEINIRQLVYTNLIVILYF